MFLQKFDYGHYKGNHGEFEFNEVIRNKLPFLRAVIFLSGHIVSNALTV